MLIEYHPAGITRYVNGKDCPTVVVHPQEFFEAIKADVFEAYFKELNDPNPKFENLRDNFKNKFLVSYGIDVENEP